MYILTWYMNQVYNNINNKGLVRNIRASLQTNPGEPTNLLVSTQNVRDHLGVKQSHRLHATYFVAL